MIRTRDRRMSVSASDRWAGDVSDASTGAL